MEIIQEQLVNEPGFYRYVLCDGRHEVNMKIDGYIFPERVENPMDFNGLFEHVRGVLPKDCEELELVVTGLTPCVLAVVTYCARYDVELVCLHYDRENDCYRRQAVFVY